METTKWVRWVRMRKQKKERGYVLNKQDYCFPASNLSEPARRLSKRPPAELSFRSCSMYTIPVLWPLSDNSIATPVLPTRSTPSSKTMVEMRTVFLLLSASTTNCLILVGDSLYNLSLAEPRLFHAAWCCFKKTLHFI